LAFKTDQFAILPKCEVMTKLTSLLASLLVQKQSSFFGGPAFSTQSELFENFLNCSACLDESRPSKKVTAFMDMYVQYTCYTVIG